MASIFGIAKKGFGKAVKKYKQSKIARGKSTREERIKFGGRSPDIKSVKPTKKSLAESKEKAYGHFYLKNIDELDKHKKAIKKGKEAKKKIQHMKDTKRAHTIGSYDAPTDPRKGSKEWDK
jgi:hypothetical protein